MRKRYGLCVLALGWCLIAVARVQAQQAEAQQILAATNQDRADHGLKPLKWDPALAQAAQAHAELMVQRGSLSHQFPGEPDLTMRAAQQGAHFSVIAENVGQASTPLGLETEWMHSPTHRANILDPRLNAIGIGVVKQGGDYYGVQDFADGVAELGPQQIEQKVGALLRQRGVQPTGSVRDARQTCEMPHGVAGGSAPKSIIRWEGADLSRLPPQLEQQLQTGRFHTAAVGACDSGHPQQGFTTYRVAVLLY